MSESLKPMLSRAWSSSSLSGGLALVAAGKASLTDIDKMNETEMLKELEASWRKLVTNQRIVAKCGRIAVAVKFFPTPNRIMFMPALAGFAEAGARVAGAAWSAQTCANPCPGCSCITPHASLFSQWSAWGSWSFRAQLWFGCWHWRRRWSSFAKNRREGDSCPSTSCWEAAIRTGWPCHVFWGGEADDRHRGWRESAFQQQEVGGRRRHRSIPCSTYCKRARLRDPKLDWQDCSSLPGGRPSHQPESNQTKGKSSFHPPCWWFPQSFERDLWWMETAGPCPPDLGRDFQTMWVRSWLLDFIHDVVVLVRMYKWRSLFPLTEPPRHSQFRPQKEAPPCCSGNVCLRSGNSPAGDEGVWAHDRRRVCVPGHFGRMGVVRVPWLYSIHQSMLRGGSLPALHDHQFLAFSDGWCSSNMRGTTINAYSALGCYLGPL